MPDDSFYDEAPTTSTFLFEVDGVQIGWYTEVSGLEVTVDVEDVEEGGVNGYVHKLPGRMSWPNLVLKRGVTQTDSLFSWMAKVSGDGFNAGGNKVERTTAAITLMASDHETRLRTWEIQGAMPVKWSGPSFAAGDDSYAQEELEIAHHGFVVSR